MPTLYISIYFVLLVLSLDLGYHWVYKIQTPLTLHATLYPRYISKITKRTKFGIVVTLMLYKSAIRKDFSIFPDISQHWHWT